MAARSPFPLGPVDDPFFPVALHEAGHALISLVSLGPTIDSVKIFETERGGVSGRVRFLNADALTCKIMMAGMAAERVVLGYAERECAWSDLDRARSIARSTCSSDDLLIEARLDRELNQTIAQLETRRDALLALTVEIMDKRFLTGCEVNQVLAGVH